MTKLAGPKPEPVDAPVFPTPWTADGSLLVDADGKTITVIATIEAQSVDFSLASYLVRLVNADNSTEEVGVKYYREAYGNTDDTFYKVTPDGKQYASLYRPEDWKENDDPIGDMYSRFPVQASALPKELR